MEVSVVGCSQGCVWGVEASGRRLGVLGRKQVGVGGRVGFEGLSRWGRGAHVCLRSTAIRAQVADRMGGVLGEGSVVKKSSIGKQVYIYICIFFFVLYFILSKIFRWIIFL